MKFRRLVLALALVLAAYWAASAPNKLKSSTVLAMDLRANS